VVSTVRVVADQYPPSQATETCSREIRRTRHGPAQGKRGTVVLGAAEQRGYTPRHHIGALLEQLSVHRTIQRAGPTSDRLGCPAFTESFAVRSSRRSRRRRVVCGHVDDRVRAATLQSGEVETSIAMKMLYLGKQRRIGHAAIEERDFDTARDCPLDQDAADEASPTQHEHAVRSVRVTGPVHDRRASLAARRIRNRNGSTSRVVNDGRSPRERSRRTGARRRCPRSKRSHHFLQLVPVLPEQIARPHAAAASIRSIQLWRDYERQRCFADGWPMCGRPQANVVTHQCRGAPTLARQCFCRRAPTPQ
jgi:hypothetical protein